VIIVGGRETWTSSTTQLLEHGVKEPEKVANFAPALTPTASPECSSLVFCCIVLMFTKVDELPLSPVSVAVNSVEAGGAQNDPDQIPSVNDDTLRRMFFTLPDFRW